MANSTTSLAMEKKEEYSGKKFRVAIIGCGGISQTHLEAYKQIPEVEIVAGVDISDDALERMETKWGLPKEALFKDWNEMLKTIKPDGVDICTPNGVHKAPAIDAANAGCHVLVEKPMAMNVAECEEMIAAAKKNNVKLTVGFQQRYTPYTDFFMNAKEAGTFGDIMFVKVQALRRRGIPNWVYLVKKNSKVVVQ
jgi:predicted dehydrogenase